MTEDAELRRLLGRTDLPSTFERWRVILEPGEERPTSGDEWAGALVLVEHGALEVDCVAGGRRSFKGGDLLVLGRLPLRALRNRGAQDVHLLALRRSGYRPKGAFLHVIRAHRPDACR